MNIEDNFPFDPERLAHELSKRGLDWADKQAAYQALDEATKSVMGQAYLQTEGTVAERDAKTRNTVGVLNHLEAVARARKASLVARVNYETYQVYLEMKRTEQSTRRAEMQIR